MSDLYAPTPASHPGLKGPTWRAGGVISLRPAVSHRGPALNRVGSLRVRPVAGLVATLGGLPLEIFFGVADLSDSDNTLGSSAFATADLTVAAVFFSKSAIILACIAAIFASKSLVTVSVSSSVVSSSGSGTNETSLDFLVFFFALLF